MNLQVFYKTFLTSIAFWIYKVGSAESVHSVTYHIFLGNIQIDRHARTFLIYYYFEKNKISIWCNELFHLKTIYFKKSNCRLFFLSYHLSANSLDSRKFCIIGEWKKILKMGVGWRVYTNRRVSLFSLWI